MVDKHFDECTLGLARMCECIQSEVAMYESLLEIRKMRSRPTLKLWTIKRKKLRRRRKNKWDRKLIQKYSESGQCTTGIPGGLTKGITRKHCWKITNCAKH